MNQTNLKDNCYVQKSIYFEKNGSKDIHFFTGIYFLRFYHFLVRDDFELIGIVLIRPSRINKIHYSHIYCIYFAIYSISWPSASF